MPADAAFAPFADAEAVARYAEGPPRLVPGFGDMHKMAGLLLAERVCHDGHVLVVGAGGGLELKAFAESYPRWTFDGVDPSPDMIRLAKTNLGLLQARVTFHEGDIQAAPDGPFDGATCLLTMHFVPIEERRWMISQIRRRLKPGAPFLAAHMSMPQDEVARSVWLSRYAAFAVSSGVAYTHAQSAAASIASRLHVLSPAQDEAILQQAGFSDVGLFYCGFTFRGWVAYA